MEGRVDAVGLPKDASCHILVGWRRLCLKNRRKLSQHPQDYQPPCLFLRLHSRKGFWRVTFLVISTSLHDAGSFRSAIIRLWSPHKCQRLCALGTVTANGGLRRCQFALQLRYNLFGFQLPTGSSLPALHLCFKTKKEENYRLNTRA